MKLYRSKNVVLENGIKSAGVLVDNGKIARILLDQDLLNLDPVIEVEDFGELVLMPGIVDSHVHVNEPGRTAWEGFSTATKAAARGGVTTIVDMPLNSIPPTTTYQNFQEKLNSARGKTHVDVAFWGGVIPENEDELLGLVQAGVVGFKCFLCPSGVDEFPHVNAKQVEKALAKLQGTNSVLAFHAELEEEIDSEGDPIKYDTFLRSRPPTMEVNAIKMIIELCEKYNVRSHIVHLSAADALPLLRDCRKKCSNLSVETCHHYLTLNAEAIADGCTQFKCCPPVRDSNNQELLWNAIIQGDIDLVVSDHSPSTSDLKCLTSCGDSQGNFLQAWGGISSLQFGLSLFWTAASKRGMQIADVTKLMSANTARLCGLHHKKGAIRVGFDADFTVWDPMESFVIQEVDIEHKNKVTPYVGLTLRGKVHSTIVRGVSVFNNGTFATIPQGILIH